MPTNHPHFLLRAETHRSERGRLRWKFTLTTVGAEESFTASDAETAADRNRLELLAVVRGLEAIDGPARVTLLTRSRYVSHGLRRQIHQWREHRWQWERFGQMLPIRDYDLWRRIDRALEYHTMECCVWETEEMPVEQAGSLKGWSVASALEKLRRGVLSPIAQFWPPSFTEAA